MRNLILALAAGAALCATGAEAMPVAGVAGAATPTAGIAKTAIVRRTVIVRRPVRRRVCTTRMGGGRRVTVCR